jgi:hypothetical protein
VRTPTRPDYVADAIGRRLDVEPHRPAPSDIDVAEIDDGFSILTLLTLEALKFCAVGEGVPSSRAPRTSRTTATSRSTPMVGSSRRGGSKRSRFRTGLLPAAR